MLEARGTLDRVHMWGIGQPNVWHVQEIELSFKYARQSYGWGLKSADCGQVFEGTSGIDVKKVGQLLPSWKRKSDW